MRIGAHRDVQNWQDNFIQSKEVVQIRQGRSAKMDRVKVLKGGYCLEPPLMGHEKSLIPEEQCTAWAEL